MHFEIELLSIGNKPRPIINYFSSSQDVFGEIDKDLDMMITFTELIEYFAITGYQGRAKDIFEKEDTNRDGIISLEEFSGPKVPKVSPVTKTNPGNHRNSKITEPLSNNKKDSESIELSAAAKKILSQVEAEVGWV